MKTLADFKRDLRMHLKFLQSSSAAFDSGETDESIRMAVSMRVLLHDTKASISLLTHLNSKDISLLSTSPNISRNAFFASGGMFFTRVQMTAKGPTATIVPCLDNGPPIRSQMKAEEWYNETVFVLSHGTDRAISRKDIILTAANKDAGAHVDANLTPQYESLKQLGGTWSAVEWKIGWEHKIIQFENIHQVILRQMAYELLNSPALLALAEA